MVQKAKAPATRKEAGAHHDTNSTAGNGHECSTPAATILCTPPATVAEVSIFARATASSPQSAQALADILTAIKDGQYRPQIEQLRHIRTTQGEKAYAQAKKCLPAFTPCGTFAPTRSKSNLVHHSRIVHGDLDHLGDVEATKRQVCSDPHIVYCFISPSGDGLKVGVCIPTVSDDENYKQYWQAVADYYAQRYGPTWDPSGKDVCRLCFVSWDSDLYVNEHAEVFAALPVPESPRDFHHDTHHSAQLHAILQGCSWLCHCRNDARTLSEPEWYAMLSIVGRCEDGERLAHELSQDYPGYDDGETAAKLTHALEAAGPRTCANISQLTGGEYCRNCPYWSKITSPICLGVDAVSAILPPFPLEVFPVALARFIKETAAALPCPPDFIGVPTLAVLGTAIGTTRVLELKPGWCEGARVWTAVVDAPGTKKSPALDKANLPLTTAQQGRYQLYKTQREGYDVDVLSYDQQLREWRKQKNAVDIPPPMKPQEPVFRQLFTTDSTVEALASVLEKNPRGVLFLQDELTGWVRGMNQYKGGKGADRQTWLSFWNGAQVVVNRKSKETVMLHHPHVCVTGCLPPDVLVDLDDERGRTDGFIHRILFAMPHVPPLTWTKDGVAEEMLNGYSEVIALLLCLEGLETEGTPQPLVLHFTPEGAEAWESWVTQHYLVVTSFFHAHWHL